MTNDYPLCKQLGLDVTYGSHYVRAADLERILEQGVRVYGCNSDSDPSQWFATAQTPKDTHSALLINIQPIVRESAEDVIESWLEWFGKADGVPANLKERSRRVLDKT